jgi:hypothetical protein
LKKPTKVRASKPQAFEVSGHQVLLTEENGAWHVSVDQAADPRRFESAAEAWAAGVGEADRLDRAAHNQA